jgi:hypothetical protein
VFLHTVYTKKARTFSLSMATSPDGGATFYPARTIVTRVHAIPRHLPNSTFRNFSLPAFAVSPVTGSMVVAWADMRKGDADVLKTTSRDGGHTWSVPARVNHDHIHNRKDQFQPSLAVAANGSYACSWFDRRYDPGNRLIDVVVAQSRDDGRYFGANLRVTPRSWNPAIGAPHPHRKSTSTFIGDYQGLVVDNLTVHPLWNDTQNGRSQEIRTANLPVSIFPHS